MLFTGRMSYVQTVILEKDFQKTIDLLGDSGWVELKRGESERKEQLLKMYEIVEDVEKKIIEVIDFFELPPSNDNGILKDINSIESFISELHTRILPYKEELAELYKKKREIDNNIKDMEQFKNLNISIEEMRNFQFIHFLSGSMTPLDAEKVKSKLGERVVIAKIETDFYILFTSRKGRWSLESELKRVGFQEKKLTIKSDGLPTQIFAELTKELTETEKKIDEIKEFKNNLFKKEGQKINEYIMSFNLQKIYQGVYQTIQHGESISLFEGWVLSKKVPSLVKKLKEINGEKFSFVSYKADELEEVKNGNLKVPVQLENIKLIKPFESLIFTYGTPSYKSFDPTLFFTITFLLFFGLMFADMGQGLVLVIIGILVQRFTKIKELGYVITCAGIMAIIFGYLFGAMFCFEHEEIAGILLPINKIFGINTPYIIKISTENIIQFFTITIIMGVITILFGMLFNILNGIIKKNIVEILFEKNGIAGFIMLSSFALFLSPIVLKNVFGIEFSLNNTFQTLSLIITFISLALIFFNEPITSLLKNHRPIFHEGVGIGLFHAVINLLFETIVNTVSNSISFVRIGAFAFSHMVLSTIVIKFVMLSGGPLSIGGIIILIIGNAIIIGIEGMIVMIQTIRLEYYEFFSKFFKDFGKQFVPFKIEKRNMGAIE